jgi:hypothetical protein
MQYSPFVGELNLAQSFSQAASSAHAWPEIASKATVNPLTKASPSV